MLDGILTVQFDQKNESIKYDTFLAKAEGC